MDTRDYSKLIEVFAAQKEISAQLKRITDDHEKRLRFIERVIGYGLGVIGVFKFLTH
jgi:hypothetical protein